MELPSYFTPEIIERAEKITTLIVDVDGVLSDGSIIYAAHGDELKCFDVQDGAGLVFWNRVGLKAAIVTGRRSNLVKRRAKEMRVDYLEMGALNKLPAYEKIVRKWKLKDEEICAIGDDLMELPILRRVGLAVAVPNAVGEVKRQAHCVTERPGGRGAVRELIDALLKINGRWDEIMRKYQI